jgi:hypothetical protein
MVSGMLGLVKEALSAWYLARRMMGTDGDFGVFDRI